MTQWSKRRGHQVREKLGLERKGEKVEGKEAVEGETQKKAKSPKPVVPENVVVAPGEGEVKPAEAPRAESPASPPAMVPEKSSY